MIIEASQSKKELLREPAGALLIDDDGPAFRDSWEAEAFAIGNLLIQQGFMSCKEWVDTFSDEIRKAQQAGDPDRGDTYFNHWMNALERICIEKGVTSREALERDKQLWALAVRNTPHGVAIALENAYTRPLPGHHHHHHHDHDHDHDHDYDHDHDHHVADEILRPVAILERDLDLPGQTDSDKPKD